MQLNERAEKATFEAQIYLVRFCKPKPPFFNLIKWKKFCHQRREMWKMAELLPQLTEINTFPSQTQSYL